MYQVVLATLTAVAMALAAKVLVPVDPVPARYMVSVVIAMLVALDAGPAMNVMAVPIGNATEPLAGIVTV
jgi:hypothetical protein